MNEEKTELLEQALHISNIATKEIMRAQEAYEATGYQDHDKANTAYALTLMLDVYTDAVSRLIIR